MIQDAAAFIWKYSFYDSDYVADERWQKRKGTIEWLPAIIPDPLPFVAAIWARIVVIGISAVFVAMSLIASHLFQELANRADDMSEEFNSEFSDVTAMKLEKWRRFYYLTCGFVEKVNRCFGPVLLVKSALGFAIPIFEFNKILLIKLPSSRFYFEFGHSIIRFLVIMLIPSYIVTQDVTRSTRKIVLEVSMFFC